MIVAVVLSTPEQILTRQIIRNSWASPSRSQAVRDGIVTVFFIVGAPKSDIEMERLLAEQRIYQDMIVTDLKDTYENLVLKVNVMLNFFIYNCRKANYLIKVDDDVSVHLDRMLAYWSQTSRNKAKIYCRLCVLCPPFRNESDKWYISRQYWGRRTYPTYCHGSFYLIGRSAAQGILRETRYFEPIPFEVSCSTVVSKIKSGGEIIILTIVIMRRRCNGKWRPIWSQRSGARVADRYPPRSIKPFILPASVN
ncbi:unnamed protein product [Haemonchus placei]|uniref:Hexosyltransferase n=1 Tax=Haemonchus placei TaxID=6290 RepID=A0A0N4WXB1_HAEPC|nr:unnamed protein product [Haemonchus placei]